MDRSEHTTAADLGSAEHLVDALIGYSLRGAPSGEIAGLIRAANASGRGMAGGRSPRVHGDDVRLTEDVPDRDAHAAVDGQGNRDVGEIEAAHVEPCLGSQQSGLGQGERERAGRPDRRLACRALGPDVSDHDAQVAR
jgi:hypothetical protein